MPTARTAALERVRDALRRGWYWGADYRWLMRRVVGQGFGPRDVPHGYGHGWRRPVLLIPGVLEEWTVMRPVADRLNAAGHPVHLLPELKRNTLTVTEGATLASLYLAAQGLREVVIVAHSKGGLIGKQVLLDDAEQRVRGLVAIATPFSGSVLARLVPARAIRALSPDDATIGALRDRTEVNHLITSICPAFDPHIPTGSRLPGARNIAVAAMGHFRVLGDPEVLAAVLAASQR